jgi:hypothetical protein
MGNLSYCRFENTARALQDCIDAVEEMMDYNGKNSYGEALSTSEKVAFEELIELCDNYSNTYWAVQDQVDDAWTKEQEGFENN